MNARIEAYADALARAETERKPIATPLGDDVTIEDAYAIQNVTLTRRRATGLHGRPARLVAQPDHARPRRGGGQPGD